MKEGGFFSKLMRGPEKRNESASGFDKGGWQAETPAKIPPGEKAPSIARFGALEDRSVPKDQDPFAANANPVPQEGLWGKVTRKDKDVDNQSLAAK